MEIRNTFSYSLPTRIVYSLIVLLKEHLIDETPLEKRFHFLTNDEYSERRIHFHIFIFNK